ncbi:MAG TPA: 1,4-alpha-glucan branching protein GlgB [Thermoplasmata archaeon]|nr:1,4-alpha-glucan branching protein GlgB [Thermoplasmata archaeon]
MDLHLFNEGRHLQLYDRLGAHPVADGSERSTRFAVWAPNAERVSLIGDFNDWTKGHDLLDPRGSSGIFEGTVEGIGRADRYKFHIESRYRGYRVDKADPFGFRHETPPATASVVWDLGFDWHDAGWMGQRASRSALDAPVAIYELHLGSWRRVPEQEHRPLTYAELADELVPYVVDLGFTHVEFLPVTEHPFYASWGYEPTGLFAPTSRFGTPQELMHLVDALHRAGLGVIFDWVPSHFPTDEHGLGYFDGTHLYEHADPRQGYHPDWNTFIYNFGRPEVRSFLASSAAFWLDRYHADGLRVDGVASMLYLDYSRKDGEWVPNSAGGRENLAAIDFLKWVNAALYDRFPGIQTVAEESTAWPMVSRPVSMGGLGFGYKWDMGWMHDTLEYLSNDPVHRRWHHAQLTFRQLYAYHENFILPLSHDEVVHLKGSLVARMPGDPWQRFANLRLLFGAMFGATAKKLLFMGGEFGQWHEWNHDASLDWHLLANPFHAGVRAWVRHLASLYRTTPALYRRDYDPGGFSWVEPDDAAQSVLSFLRYGPEGTEPVLVALNYTPLPRPEFRVGVPVAGPWKVVANSDDPAFGGSGWGARSARGTEPVGLHGHAQSIVLDLPPLAALYVSPGESP